MKFAKKSGKVSKIRVFRFQQLITYYYISYQKIPPSMMHMIINYI